MPTKTGIANMENTAGPTDPSIGCNGYSAALLDEETLKNMNALDAYSTDNPLRIPNNICKFLFML